MSIVTSFANASPRAESIEQLVSVLPECIQRTAEEIGVDGVKAFFNGYRVSQDEEKLAA